MYNYNPNLWESVTARTKIISDSECMTLCEETEACVAFTFSSGHQYCFLLGKPFGGGLVSPQHRPGWKSGLCIGKVTKGKNLFLFPSA